MKQITYIASKTFARLHADVNRFLFVRGPVGSGKSSGCVWHIFQNACKQIPDHEGIRHSRYAIIRATYPALKSTVIKTWQSWFSGQLKVVYDIPIRGILQVDLEDGTKVNCELVFVAVDDLPAVEKLRSMELTGAHCNEASELTPELFEMLKSRIRRFPAKKDGGTVNPFILFDYNSVPTDHWLYELAEVTKPSLHSFYTQPPAVHVLSEKEVKQLRPEDMPNVAQDKDGNVYRVNPEADNYTFLESDYYIEQVHGGDPDFISVNLMNNYGTVRTGKPVYKDYDDSEHCTKTELKPMEGVPIIVGMDQGLTPAAVFVQQNPSDGSILILDEITTEDCSLREFCENHLWPLINVKYGKWKSNITLIVDPATNQRSMNDAKAGTEIIKEAGFKYRTAKTNSAVSRREAVIYFLRQRKKFFLSPSCTALRKGFISEYKYERTKTASGESFKDTPAKNEYSHPHDALQYAALEFAHVKKRRNIVKRDTYTTPSLIGGY